MKIRKSRMLLFGLRRFLQGPGGSHHTSTAGNSGHADLAVGKALKRSSSTMALPVAIGFVFLWNALLLFFTGCSSLPKKIEPQLQVEADIRMNRAREAQNRGDHEVALAFYLDAYEFYTRMDLVQGKINAGLSISRQYFYLNQKVESRKWLRRASELIESAMPEMQIWEQILMIETAFTESKFQQVVELASKVLPVEKNLEVETEILCYLMVSKARLNKDYNGELSRIQTMLPILHKRFRKRKLDDSEVLSLGYYYCGYIFSSVEIDWQKALRFFMSAKEIDGLIGNSYGVGKDLFAIGRCYEGLKESTQASGYFLRSLEVFRLLGDDDMIKKVERKLDVLKK
jgi:tetratricopeptide (TPR) repeat protein